MCGRWIKNHVGAEDSAANCQKCLDARYLKVGKLDHQLSILPTRSGDKILSDTGVCSCDKWRTTVKVGESPRGTGVAVVERHYEHILAAVRGASTVTQPAPVGSATEPCPRHVYDEPTDACTCPDPKWSEHLRRVERGIR